MYQCIQNTETGKHALRRKTMDLNLKWSEYRDDL